MPFRIPPDMVGRDFEWRQLCEFATAPASAATLGIVWGRRRIGKSFLLRSLVERSRGFYYEAVRGSAAEALRELGGRLAEYDGAAAPYSLPDWDAAAAALLALGRSRDVTVVLDEYPYLLEHSPELDSILQRAFGPRGAARSASQARLILCGSALSVMSKLLSGSAPLRGRAGLDMRLAPFDFRQARELHGVPDLSAAVDVYAIIGGVAAYAREMVGGDVPSGGDDLERWVAERVLTPSSPLFHEASLLLSEDAGSSKARKINLYHAVLAGIAMGHRVHGRLASYVKLSGASLAPIVDALVSAGMVERVEDPVRDHRPTYHPGDPLIRFHYAVIRPNQSRLARYGADVRRIWHGVQATFRSQVVGPCFEGMARYWTRSFADEATTGGRPDYVGPTTVSLPDGTPAELDVVSAEDASGPASSRPVRCIGEAKSGTALSPSHLARLEAARATLGPRARDAKLLLFGTAFTPRLRSIASQRADVELVDLDRMYHGS